MWYLSLILALALCSSYLLIYHFCVWYLDNVNPPRMPDVVQNPDCHPSSCGNNQNISFPFRLRGDPVNCGDFELECKNNNTTLLLDSDSREYLVQAINYNNQTIRLRPDGLRENDMCSFPKNNFRGDGQFLLPYGSNRYWTPLSPQTSIVFMSCPYRMNSSFLISTDHCFQTSSVAFNSSSPSSYRRRHTYVSADIQSESEVGDMCSIDLAVFTSLYSNNTSLQQIHRSLLYGGEVFWSTPPRYHFSRWYRFWTGETMRTVFSHMYFFDEHPAVICGGVVATRIIIGLPFLLWIIIYKVRRNHLSVFDAIEAFLQSHNNFTPIRYSYSDISKMTKRFREKLGEGGYGSVYKGKLRSRQDVAVKVLTKPSANRQDFINEVATIGRIHHVNVVKLVGYSAERSKCALVYDFMPNGSLEKYILRQESNNLLTWETMYKIAVGVARGIEYLHRGCDIQILHFDIKPHNILLDDNFTPKISDFGLAKFYSTQKNTVTLTAVRGTIGYVAPELINRSIGNVSHKADVYSFGMLLLELVGLKRDLVQNSETSTQYFPNWIYSYLEKAKDVEIGNIDGISTDDDDDDARKITRKIGIIGLWCIRMNPDDRPPMSKVLEMLEGDVENLEVPPQPTDFESHVRLSEDQTCGTYSSDSVSLLVE